MTLDTLEGHPPHVRIALVRTEDGGVVRYKARPAYAAVSPGEKVRFVNGTAKQVTLRFPAGLFEEETITLPSRRGMTLILRGDAQSGQYSGVVENAEGDSQVHGESSPEIIIDR